MRVILFVCVCFFSFSVSAQDELDSLDMSRIPQKKIRNFIHILSNNEVKKFSQVQPSYHEGDNMMGYTEVESSYIVKDSPDKVFRKYRQVSPAESWDGKKISFGVLISKWNNMIMYRNDKRLFTGIDTGQVFLVNLKLMKGMCNLAVGLEIISVDSVKKCIKFSYVKGNKSEGEQIIQFVATNEGYTRIIHRTEFKSNSKFRDKYLYPYFHRQAINEFHRNVLGNMLAIEYKDSLGIPGDGVIVN